MSENNEKEYDGWREPKIAMSFHRNRLKYYGVVWVLIITFIFLKNVSGVSVVAHVIYAPVIISFEELVGNVYATNHVGAVVADYATVVGSICWQYMKMMRKK